MLNTVLNLNRPKIQSYYSLVNFLKIMLNKVKVHHTYQLFPLLFTHEAK